MSVFMTSGPADTNSITGLTTNSCMESNFLRTDVLQVHMQTIRVFSDLNFRKPKTSNLTTEEDDYSETERKDRRINTPNTENELPRKKKNKG
jgi:hypothetical protein